MEQSTRAISTTAIADSISERPLQPLPCSPPPASRSFANPGTNWNGNSARSQKSAITGATSLTCVREGKRERGGRQRGRAVWRSVAGVERHGIMQCAFLPTVSQAAWRSHARARTAPCTDVPRPVPFPPAPPCIRTCTDVPRPVPFPPAPPCTRT
eukprot:111401-Chlamydomonas_euryale.AAC.1